MTTATTTGGAVALLLCGPRLRLVAPGAHEELRGLIGSPLTDVVDEWIAEGGPDGEQIYCLEDLLTSRLVGEPTLHRRAEDVLTRRTTSAPDPTGNDGQHTAGTVAALALKELARHCREHGFLGGYDWCQQALAVPRQLAQQLGQAPPAPLNRTVTAPR